jgi:LCP family protein required for cell wall assembly
MLLVEVDVATGRVAMFGFPRNMVNVPLPPGAARNASPCGCFQKLLNEVYTDATFYYPELWPGEGSVSGIAAVRATISELTQRPIDAVLVADLWGVIKVVDAMGGIDMNVTEPVYDNNYPDPVLGSIQLRIGTGQQRLNGRLALAYARSRHQDSDYGRMRRQQALDLERAGTRSCGEGVRVDGSAAQLPAESGGSLLACSNSASAPLPLRPERLPGVPHSRNDRQDSNSHCERLPGDSDSFTKSVGLAIFVRFAINQS